jgi:hypothetical protein
LEPSLSSIPFKVFQPKVPGHPFNPLDQSASYSVERAGKGVSVTSEVAVSAWVATVTGTV